MEYEWGDDRLIPETLGIEPSGKPCAELWMGAHPKAPSKINGIPLDEILANDPVRVLGGATASAASSMPEFPYLFKLLAVAKPLSIQAHPTKRQAREGFAREESEGIDKSLPTRVYLDANPKPEIAAALTGFEAKCGFRPVERSRALFSELAAYENNEHLQEIVAHLGFSSSSADRLQLAMAWLLDLRGERLTSVVDATVRAAVAIHRDDHEFADDLRWTGIIHDAFPGDIGVVVALLLNHVKLEPGEALFLHAGQIHAYLCGGIIELMANSDNVIRGGLTPKHKDVSELLRVVDFEPHVPPVQIATNGHHRFDSPVPEFRLSRHDFTSGEPLDPFHPSGPEILFVTQGTATVTWGEGADDVITAGRGSQILVTGATSKYRLTSTDALVWRAAPGRRAE